MYIGSTLSIKSRIKKHKVSKPKFDFVLIHKPDGHLYSYMQQEAYLIKEISPPWNKQIPFYETELSISDVALLHPRKSLNDSKSILNSKEQEIWFLTKRLELLEKKYTLLEEKLKHL